MIISPELFVYTSRLSRNVRSLDQDAAPTLAAVYHTFLAPNKADSAQLFVYIPFSVSGVCVGIIARHVGHMEQHSGAQKAVGLSAGEAAAAAEGSRTAVRG